MNVFERFKNVLFNFSISVCYKKKQEKLNKIICDEKWFLKSINIQTIYIIHYRDRSLIWVISW